MTERGGAGEPARVVTRASVLGRFTRLYPEARYLEVGVAKGATFFNVPATRKVAVDPVFRFDVEQRRREHPGTEFHEMPSDEYFATVVEPDEQFDVVFLDGLHVYEQTLRDLLNVLGHVQPQGVIVVDDTHPPTHLASIPDLDTYRSQREQLGTDDKRWMGDVFKLVWFVESFMPALSFRTISNNHGQTVFWRSRRTTFPPRELGEIADLTFEQMVREEHVLQLRPYGEIRREIRRSLGL